ncbi:MAG: ankyrin repeat domain-containing protein [Acidobacteriota bacterium]
MLLARGADPTSNAAEKTELLRIVFGERPEVRRVLADAGLDVNKLMPLEGAPLTTFPSLSDAALVRELLDRGVNPNPRGRFPIVANAVFEGHLDTVRALLERGADPNARGQHEVTPLMMAAAATRPDPSMVRLLIDKGADVRARDAAGRTALDWALLQGDTPVVAVLREAGAPPAAPVAAPSPVSTPRSARAAVTAALNRLTPGGPVLYKQRNCISCHHQTLPLMAVARAEAKGIAVEETARTHPIRAILDVWSSRRENLMLARSRDGGGANELTYGLVALADANVPPDPITDAAASNLISTQRSDGSWVFLDTRPPQADNSRIPFTAMAIRGLAVYAPPGLRGDARASAERALAFLRRATPASTQDEAFKLLGLVWARVPAREIAAQTQRLVALQRDDGGWAQLPTMQSDAYATGQALFALEATDMPRAERAYQRGVAYLLRTQLDDGTWFVRSRAFGFQPYFETGFPHGVDQFNSASATAWAAIALASVS